jgi:hypothetical protein
VETLYTEFGGRWGRGKKEGKNKVKAETQSSQRRGRKEKERKEFGV